MTFRVEEDAIVCLVSACTGYRGYPFQTRASIMALLILFLLHLQIRRLTTRFPACKAHEFSSQLSCPLQKLKKRESDLTFRCIYHVFYALSAHGAAVVRKNVETL